MLLSLPAEIRLRIYGFLYVSEDRIITIDLHVGWSQSDGEYDNAWVVSSKREVQHQLHTQSHMIALLYVCRTTNAEVKDLVYSSMTFCWYAENPYPQTEEENNAWLVESMFNVPGVLQLARKLRKLSVPDELSWMANDEAKFGASWCPVGVEVEHYSVSRVIKR